jgi:DNA primase
VIPQPFIQELLARVDIVEVVGRHVKLRKGGANWIGLCPFHGEKSPSFTVSPTKQFYHCFGCGAHGSAIGFLMEHTGLGYVDAIHELARGAGLAVPQERGAAESRRHAPDLLETLALAARFYRSRLKDAPHAIDYLRRRGVTGETAARYGIGYAPDGWRPLEAAVADYAAPLLVEAGLVVEPEAEPDDGGRRRRYDRFRNRVIFPIRNPRGQVIAFGGRVLGDEKPKYLNSPETPLFSKGRELYGLFEAREALRASGCAIVVEGYMDVVMLAQHGVANAVATLGTAVTAHHVQKLLRLADRVVFAFDGDAAGRSAAWRALEACLPHAGDTQRIDFLFLPPDHDPDSFVRAHGAQGFERALAGAWSLSDFMLRELASHADLGTPEGRARFQAEARPLLRALPRAALRMQLTQAVAGKVGVRADELAAYLEDDAAGASRPVPATDGRGGPASPGAGPRDGGRSAGDSRGGGPGRGRPWEGGGWRPPQRPAPVELPDLERRVRLLLALHPGLARDLGDTEFLPAAVVQWIHRLAEPPGHPSFASLVESMREAEPGLAAALQSDAARDRGLLAELDAAAARQEIDGALARLRAQGVRAEVDRLAGTGLLDDAQRQRYAALQALRKSLTSSAGP